MTYIKLEDVTTIIANYYPISHSWIDILDFTEKINSLPSIDPQGIIQEMLKDFVIIDDHDEWYRDAIIAVLEKLTK